jgi:phosphoglycerol transferase MdoB-like AlkP superfamily enzyme
MSSAVAYLWNRLAAVGSSAPAARFALLALLHGMALIIMLKVEQDVAGLAAFVLTWGILNFLGLIVLRRPAAAAALSLAMVLALIGLSLFKHDILFMTVNFLDLMIVDVDTFSFLLTVFPWLGRVMLASVAAAVLLVSLIWWFDPHRIRRRSATLGCAACVFGLTGLTYAVPADPYDEFYPIAYVSKFGRSAVTAVFEYATRGLLESDASAAERLATTAHACPVAKRPHIIMVHDESSFDFSTVPGIKVPPDYRRHFASFDGRFRSLIVEGAGGPSWYTEYNVLAGLSARSYGRFADFVTRIAAGRVERGLPHALRRCGYRTFSLYSYYGAFLNARQFQKTVGIEHFLDAKDLGAEDVDPDGFFFDKAAGVIARERGRQPLFLLVYTLANHFPWNHRYRPDLTPPGWIDPGNGFEPDEYLRRQTMSARDYRAFVERLKREFPDEQFLIVRFGDHQPSVARSYIDPAFDDSARARRLADHDVRFLTSYYAIDAINYRPADLTSALDTLDAPYLPLVVLEAAGVPLDPSFAEQKRILERCRGLFYRCHGGAEARRFNRMLIDAGLIKGL